MREGCAYKTIVSESYKAKYSGAGIISELYIFSFRDWMLS